MVMEGLVNLRPRLLQALLEDAGSIKVKRLFLFLRIVIDTNGSTISNTAGFCLPLLLSQGGVLLGTFPHWPRPVGLL